MKDMNNYLIQTYEITFGMSELGNWINKEECTKTFQCFRLLSKNK